MQNQPRRLLTLRFTHHALHGRYVRTEGERWGTALQRLGTGLRRRLGCGPRCAKVLKAYDHTHADICTCNAMLSSDAMTYVTLWRLPSHLALPTAMLMRPLAPLATLNRPSPTQHAMCAAEAPTRRGAPRC